MAAPRPEISQAGASRERPFRMGAAHKFEGNTHCPICQVALEQPAHGGRPRKRCGRRWCDNMAESIRFKRSCARCFCPLLFEGERLTGHCWNCAPLLARDEGAPP